MNEDDTYNKGYAAGFAEAKKRAADLCRQEELSDMWTDRAKQCASCISILIGGMTPKNGKAKKNECFY